MWLDFGSYCFRLVDGYFERRVGVLIIWGRSFSDGAGGGEGFAGIDLGGLFFF